MFLLLKMVYRKITLPLRPMPKRKKLEKVSLSQKEVNNYVPVLWLMKKRNRSIRTMKPLAICKRSLRLL